MSTTKEDFKKSFQDFKALLTTGYDLEDYPPSIIKGKTFDTKFPNALIFKPTYEDCKFIGTNFEGTNMANSKLHLSKRTSLKSSRFKGNILENTKTKSTSRNFTILKMGTI